MSNDGGPELRLCRKCSGEFEPRSWQIRKSDYECPSCRRSRQNTFNRAHPERLRAKARANYRRNVEYYTKYQREQVPPHVRAARRKVATEIEAGRLKRTRCEVCDTSPAEAHHDDYGRPLDIAWLCRAHHVERHAMLAERGRDE